MLRGMSRLAIFDRVQLARVLARQHQVISRDQAFACAMSQAALRYRIRPDGPWQPILPGVYLAGRGAAGRNQRASAAWAYAGRAIAITGVAALEWHATLVDQPGSWRKAENPDAVDVLVPVNCRRQDAGFARLHRTALPPPRIYDDGDVGYVPVPRAVADAARYGTAMSDIRALVAGAVQQDKVTVSQLAAEVDRGSPRGTAQLRAVLADVADGIRSSTEADLKKLIKREGLPEPMYNARLFVNGKFLAVTDAWWPQACVAVEVDSREWHLSPADWQYTMDRHAKMTACGILLLHFPPKRLRSAGRVIGAEIRATLEVGRSRPLPQIVARPA
jgi:hypothetical protein